MKNRAFTLLECLVAMLVLSLSLLMLTAVFLQVPKVNQLIAAKKEQEWQAFFIQFERELQGCTYVSASSRELLLKNSKNQTVKINLANRILKKQENNGYQPLLTEVESVNFEQKNTIVELSIMFTNGEKKIGHWKIQ